MLGQGWAKYEGFSLPIDCIWTTVTPEVLHMGLNPRWDSPCHALACIRPATADSTGSNSASVTASQQGCSCCSHRGTVQLHLPPVVPPPPAAPLWEGSSIGKWWKAEGSCSWIAPAPVCRAPAPIWLSPTPPVQCNEWPTSGSWVGGIQPSCTCATPCGQALLHLPPAPPPPFPPPPASS